MVLFIVVDAADAGPVDAPVETIAVLHSVVAAVVWFDAQLHALTKTEDTSTKALLPEILCSVTVTGLKSKAAKQHDDAFGRNEMSARICTLPAEVTAVDTADDFTGFERLIHSSTVHDCDHPRRAMLPTATTGAPGSHTSSQNTFKYTTDDGADGTDEASDRPLRRDSSMKQSMSVHTLVATIAVVDGDDDNDGADGEQAREMQLSC